MIMSMTQRSGIAKDPNPADDPESVVRLIA